MKRKVSILSLGCSKNLVDSERLARRFDDAGLEASFVETVPADGSFLIINTCGFIGDAKEESVNTLLEAIAAKGDGSLSGVYAMGCLTERYRAELSEEMPELDGFEIQERIRERYNLPVLTFLRAELSQRRFHIDCSDHVFIGNYRQSASISKR